MEDKKIKSRVEVMGDYDGVLYHVFEDDTMQNVHTGVFFDETTERTQYSPLYQYKDWKLVWYSTYKAEWLTIDEDINEWQNLLWGWRGIDWKQPIVFKPIKSLSIPHIKSIIINWTTRNKEYLSAFTDKLTNVININNG